MPYQLSSEDRQRLSELLLETLTVSRPDQRRLEERAGEEELALVAFASFPSPLRVLLDRELKLSCPEGEPGEFWRSEPLSSARAQLKAFRQGLLVGVTLDRHPRGRPSALAERR